MDDNCKEEAKDIEKKCDRFGDHLIKKEKKINELLKYNKKSTDSDEIKAKKLCEESRDLFSKPFIDIEILEKGSKKLLTNVLENPKFEEKPTCSDVDYNDNQNSIYAWARYPSKKKDSELCVTVIKYLSKVEFDIYASLDRYERFGFTYPAEAPERSIEMLKSKISEYEKELKK